MLWLAALPLAVHLQAVDAVTGAGLPARVTVTASAQSPALHNLPAEGGEPPLPAGPFELLVEAGGHAPLRARFDHSRGALPITFVLDPDPPARAPPARSEADEVILQGFVRDERARPVAGATVALPALGLQAGTDGTGFFRLSVPAPAAPDPRQPALATLRITAPGFAAHEVAGVLLADDAVLRETLVRGGDTDVRDDTPKVLRKEAPDGGAGALPAPGSVSSAAVPEGNGLPIVLDPPASIRVGTSCSCSTCAAVSVMSLETYVARGLNDEWIASWHAHSLRAGAVAYRSYGAWYVEHPLSGTYDICSTTCCQVNDTDTSAATDAAVARTAGSLLERGGAVFRSEYSAENNAWDDPGDGLSCTNADLSCGDGLAGSPATGWPCLADGVDAGHGCFGHGRGACQWGTQRWATTQGRSWAWILDHYYNDHGAGTGMRTARLASPVALQQAGAPPNVGRGQRFTIQVTAANLAELPRPHLLIGASLRRAARVISDPAHDAPVVLAPGTGTASRVFDVPRFAPLGTYDLLVALYEDLDENGVIGGADLPLQLLTLPGAVRVCVRAVNCPEP
jgi:hypothetical protein